jgi:hypothetical protein
MKRELAILTILFIMTGCGGCSNSGSESDAFFTVDVTKSYPKKELILQDFMDVEYIALETSDEFLTQGWILAVGEDIILVRNSINDGNIMVFDRTGKGLRTINRMGQGSEEYTVYNVNIVLDEDNNEMFVSDVNRVLVYDTYGTFKRSFRHKEGFRYTNMCNFDRENLICQNNSYNSDEAITDKPPFVVISKQDGSIVKDISIIGQQKMSAKSINQDGRTITAINPSNFPGISIIPYHGNWIFTVYSTDTVFRYLPDQHRMIPFMARTPSIQSDNSETSLFPEILTERYYFLRLTKYTSPEITGTPQTGISLVFPSTDLMYDRKEKAIYESTIYNEDYSDKTAVNISRHIASEDIAFWQKIEAHELVVAYKQGHLKGKLKDIAAELNEENNPVIMLVKHKE